MAGSETTAIAPEFWWLAVMGVAMAVASLPYVLDRIVSWGLWGALDNPRAGLPKVSPWAERLKAAHYNCVENLVVFGPLAVSVVVAGVANEMTAMAAMAFTVSRIVYLVVYMLGIPVLRTLAFLVGWLSSLVLALVLLGLL